MPTMETNHALVARYFQQNGFSNGYWTPKARPDIRMPLGQGLAVWLSAPGQPRPQAHRGNTGGRGGEKGLSGLVYGGVSRYGVKPSPGVPRRKQLRRLLSILGRRPRHNVGAWLPPGHAEGPRFVQQLSKGPSYCVVSCVQSHESQSARGGDRPVCWSLPL